MDNFESAKTLFLEGLALFEAERFSDAEERFRKSLDYVPDRLSTLTNLSSVLIKQKKYGEAKGLLKKLLAMDDSDTEAWQNLGVICSEEDDHDEALICFERVLVVDPKNSTAHYNRGNVLKVLNRPQDALNSYDRAVALNPEYAEAWMNRGVVLKLLNRPQNALESYERAVALNPEYAEAWINRGTLLDEIKDYPGSIESYKRAYALMPTTKYLFGGILHGRMKICDWSTYDANVCRILDSVKFAAPICSPFPLLGLASSPLLHLTAAESYAADKYPEQIVLGPIPKRCRHNKIRIGYYSADFHNHATAYLIAQLFEMHDRGKFELVGISWGPVIDDELRRRISIAFDHFIDVRDKTDIEVAQMSRMMEIDIAVDLKGYTQDCRSGIFACRAAPIQVNYLGFPGTMGANYIDYLIADKTVIPEQDCQYYKEKIVWLPNCYQVNDSRRQIAEKIYSRAELGLSASSFVFCCFNNNYKITPATFDGWMRILKKVDSSVLWLFKENEFVAENLRKEAEVRGVDAGRLIFAGRLPPAEHLARHRVADLFLDTLPINAHTTASDALWAGLPLLTRIGESFAGRVAASLLKAIGLPELITSSQEEFEALAIVLATDPVQLRQIRKKLNQNRLCKPLYDTPLFVKHLEAGYVAMYECYLSELPVENITVQ